MKVRPLIVSYHKSSKRNRETAKVIKRRIVDYSSVIVVTQTEYCEISVDK